MIYAMSDIHGCLEALIEKMKYVDLSENNKIIFLGDYIDYGPQSGQVLQYLFNLQKEYGTNKVIILKGNHEDMLLGWIDEFKRKKHQQSQSWSYDLWMKTDSEQGYNTIKTLITKEQFEKLRLFEKKASFLELNNIAVEMVINTNNVLINWMRSMNSFYKTETQIFVHAGIDENAEDLWEWGTSEEIFLWKYPATTGYFYKTIIAGHIGTSSLAKIEGYHEIFYDGESHYYIDGTVSGGGKLLLLVYEEETGQYYQIENNKKIEISKS